MNERVVLHPKENKAEIAQYFKIGISTLYLYLSFKRNTIQARRVRAWVVNFRHAIIFVNHTKVISL